MSKIIDAYFIREHENSALTPTIPKQTRLLFIHWSSVFSFNLSFRLNLAGFYHSRANRQNRKVVDIFFK